MELMRVLASSNLLRVIRACPVKQKILGSSGCKLSEEFAGISKISKTDLIINGNIKCSAKKAGGSQIASSQHKELTTVISAVLKDFPDIKNKIVANITQTLAQLMEKSFYYNHAAVINKNLTTLSTTSDQKKTKEAVNNLISLIKSPDAVTEIKIEEKEMHQMLAELNKIFKFFISKGFFNSGFRFLKGASTS